MPPDAAAWLPHITSNGGGAQILRDTLTVVFLSALAADVVMPPLLYLLLQLADRSDRRLGSGRYRPGQPTPPSDPVIHMRPWRRSFLSRIKFAASLEFALGFMAAFIGYAIVGGNPIRFALYAILLVSLFVLLATVPGGISVYLAERANIRRRYATLSRRAPLTT